MIAVKPDDAIGPCDAAVDDAHDAADDDDADDVDAVVSPPQRRKSQRLTVSDEEDDGLDGRNITTHSVEFFGEMCVAQMKLKCALFSYETTIYA